MNREKSIYEEAAEKSDVKQDKYLTRNKMDGDRCDGCQFRFADLEKQEQECKTCLFYLLQED